MSTSKHDKIAQRIAKREGTEYNKGPGADVQSRRRAIEIETPQTLGDAARQLQGYQKPVYVVPTDRKAVPAAVEHYKGTTIGVMSPGGAVVKRSTRGRNR
jgi:hypothetical protein